MQQLYVQHRVNKVADLERADTAGGVEIDLRSNVQVARGLHLSHDPWVLGEDFESWLRAYARRGFAGPLVLNTKEDGLEETIFTRLEAAGITNFFFLDTAPPTLVRLLSLGLGAHVSLRISVWETAQAAQPWLKASLAKHRPAWAWVDCFDGAPLPISAVEPLMTLRPDVKICLVSPELQRASIEQVPKFCGLWGLSSAVCTKRPDAWRHAMENQIQ